MSLRARLAIVYNSVFVGLLILFGAAVYGLVSVVLMRSIDNLLQETALDVLALMRYSEAGGLIQIRPISVDPRVEIQMWDEEGNLLTAPPLASFSSIELDDSQLVRSAPLDPAGLRAREAVFSEVIEDGVHWRVWSLPLETELGALGVLQVGIDLAEVDKVRNDLLGDMIGMAIIAMTVSSIAGWLTTRRAMAPLSVVTETATQITRADDLSRRIPQQGPLDDEVGQLIQAFNQTLARLEDLFYTQRRFLADVSHELRTPLTIIKGNLDLVNRMGEIDQETLESMRGEVDRLSRLVGDLLLLAEAESDKLPLDAIAFEMDTLLLEVFQEARVLAGDKVDLRIGEFDQVLVCGDRDRLKQVILNLIGNAIQYSGEGGAVVVGLGKGEGWAYLKVRDNGPGIPEEDLPYIFDRFYRAEKSRARGQDGKGFGLGLSIAYWIVKNHGGRIQVDSEEGAGTEFCVWLPLAEEARQEVASRLTPDAG